MRLEIWMFFDLLLKRLFEPLATQLLQNFFDIDQPPRPEVTDQDINLRARQLRCSRIRLRIFLHTGIASSERPSWRMRRRLHPRISLEPRGKALFQESKHLSGSEVHI